MDQRIDEGAIAYGFNSYEHMRAEVRRLLVTMHKRAAVGFYPERVIEHLDADLQEIIWEQYLTEVEEARPVQGASRTSKVLAGAAGLAFGFGMARHFR